MVDTLDTDAIRARLEALTTPPPWSVVRDKLNDGLIQHGVKGQWNIWAYRPICEPLGGSGNARFIAAAPTDIAVLLDEVERTYAQRRNDECWAVCYSNYHPIEIDSLWATRELADRRADGLNDESGITSWNVQRCQINTQETDDD